MPLAEGDCPLSPEPDTPDQELEGDPASLLSGSFHHGGVAVSTMWEVLICVAPSVPATSDTGPLTGPVLTSAGAARSAAEFAADVAEPPAPHHGLGRTPPGASATGMSEPCLGH
jgi:hypothetical protein